jgi:cell division protein FtsZ
VPIKEGKPLPEKNVQAKQEVLQFEPVTRGRFEKSEPTIVEGEDLDVPTYLRKKIKVK